MNEIFKSIFDRLTSQLSQPVYDHVPENNETFPFVKVGPLDLTNNDTDLELGFRATITILGFSRYRGTKEAGDISLAVYNALHHWAMPATTSYKISLIQQDFSNIILASDGITRNSINRFTIIFE